MQYSKSRVLGIINWLHVFRIYVPFIGFIALGVLVVQLLHTLYTLRFDLQVGRTPSLATYVPLIPDALLNVDRPFG